MQVQLGWGRHQQDFIISPEGVCKALTAGSHLNADWMTLIYEDEEILRSKPFKG